MDYYITNNLNPIDSRIAQKLGSETILVNYSWQRKDNSCLRKAKFAEATYYEINFETAYKFLYCMPKNEYTKLERYFFGLMRLVFKETATELIDFLQKTNCFSQERLLEIEKIFNTCKISQLKKRLSQKATTEPF